MWPDGGADRMAIANRPAIRFLLSSRLRSCDRGVANRGVVVMSAALPAFQLASDLPLSPDEREAYEAQLQALMNQLDSSRQDSRGTNLQPEPKSHPVMQSAEKQALLEALSDLGERIKALELLAAKQARQIEELQSLPKDQSDQIGLLKDGIVRLQAEVASCTQLQKNHSAVLSKLIDRINEQETKKGESETNTERAKKIKEYLAENGTLGKFLDKRTMKLIEGRAVRFELLRSYLVIDKWQLNRALHTLLKMHPGEYCKKKLNKTTWLLIERPKL
jgi:hypothetical protein